MSKEKMFEAFGFLFPMFKDDIADYFPYTYILDSIRIRFNDGLNVLFTYKSATDWKIQTYESYLNERELKGEQEDDK